MSDNIQFVIAGALFALLVTAASRMTREQIKNFLDPPCPVCPGDVVHYKGNQYPIGEMTSFKDPADFEDFLAHSEMADWETTVGGAVFGFPPGFFRLGGGGTRTIRGRGLRRKRA